MMKVTLSILSAALLGAVSLSTQAQEYMFTYSKLYTHLKQNASEGHEDVKVGFFFINADTKKLCKIEKAWMEKEQHYEEIKVSATQEVLVPLDNNLRSANPLVFIDTPQDQRCDFSMVVMTKQPMSGQVGYQQIAELLPQMQSILEQLGGMFANWFTPKVEGVTLEFANQLNSSLRFSNGDSKPIVNGKVQVTLQEIGEGGSIYLPEQTTRVLPYLPSAK